MRNVLVVFSGKAQSGKSTSSAILRDIIIEQQIEELNLREDISGVERTEDGCISFVEIMDGRPQGTFVGPRAEIFSFATALKKIAKEYFNWDGDKGIYYEKKMVGGLMQPKWYPMADSIAQLSKMPMPKFPEEYEMTNGKLEDVPIPDRGRQLLINIGQHMRAIRPTIWVDYVINRIKKQGAEGSDKVFIIDDMRFKNELNLAKTFDACVSIRLTRTSQLDINDTSENDLDDATFDYYIENNGDEVDLKSKISGLFEQIKLKYQ